MRTGTWNFISLAALITALTACAYEPAIPPAPPPPIMAAGECDAEAAAFAIGKPIDAQLMEQAKTRAGAQRVRVLRPGDMTTMEFDARRLNLDVDGSGRVVKVRCG